MPPPPIRDDRDAIRRMNRLAARLRALACPADQIPSHLIAEGDLLRSYIHRRVCQVTADLDQNVAATLAAIESTAAG